MVASPALAARQLVTAGAVGIGFSPEVFSA
jgi:hypothetical protein